MNGWWAALAVGLVTTVLAVVLKPTRADFAVIVSVVGGALMLLIMRNELTTLVAYIRDWMDEASLSDSHATIMLKAVGVGIVTEWAADTCRDAGETALANKSETVGKIGIAILSVPVFAEWLSVLESVLQGMNG